MDKVFITIEKEDGSTEKLEVLMNKETEEILSADGTTLGTSLGCLLGLHAWGPGNKCVYCGKQR